MDQDKAIKTPKYAEHYKNVEQRKMYQRQYQLDRYHRKKALASAGQGEIMENKQVTPAPVGSMGAAPVDQLTQALDALTATLGPDDGVSKFIKKVQPFVPIATAFVQGFVQNMNARQAEQQQSQQQAPGIQPPEGWVYADAMTKLKRKYDAGGNISSWFLQGEYYDQQMAMRGVGAGVQSGMPSRMESTIHGQREAAISRRNNEMAAAQQRTMRDLEKEAQHFDKKADMTNAKEVPRTDGAPETINQAIESKEVQENAENKPTMTGEQAKEIIQEIAPKLQEDAVKYINLVVSYFKTRPLDQFEKDLKNVDQTIVQYGSFIDLLPFAAKEAFKRVSAEELEGMLKESDPEKHKMIVKKKLKGKLFKLWDELKARL